MTREELLALSNEQLKIDQYSFAVRPLSEEDGGGYLVEFPDVPGCMSDGATRQGTGRVTKADMGTVREDSSGRAQYSSGII